VCGLASGIAFGVTAPLAKRLVADVAPVPLASLLYLGAGIGLGLLAVARRSGRGAREAALQASDRPTLAAMIVVGGLVGPVLMLVGFTHVSGVAGALLLNLEAPFTMLLAVALFGDHLGPRALMGALLVIAGAALLSASPGEVSADGVGVAAVAGACLAWAVDNNLAARLALRDPLAVARWKTAGAGTLGALLSVGLGMRFPSLRVAGTALLVGFVGYGLSIVLAVKAVRALGAARQAAFFAIAPFVGAVGAVPLLGETLGPRALAAAVLMSGGLVMLWREEHAHIHTHEALAHDHLHVHDAHHQHVHDQAGTGSEPHAHPHVHGPLTHAHPHLPDAHHRHRH